MKILIGTPIHQLKDYAMERWLKNVRELTNHTPADLLMVDNSKGADYVEKVKKYCKKLGLKNCSIEHLEIDQRLDDGERIARSREIIRHHVLQQGYDAWFSWECDQLIPLDALDKLINLMKMGDFMIVDHNGWGREDPNLLITDLGVSLVGRECLEKYTFLLKFGTDPEMPNGWQSSEAWLKRQILKNKGSYLEVFGIIEPIYHLNE